MYRENVCQVIQMLGKIGEPVFIFECVWLYVFVGSNQWQFPDKQI